MFHFMGVSFWLYDSEDNPDLVGGTSSDEVANVTVVAKGDVAQMEQDASLLSQDLFQVKRGMCNIQLRSVR